MTVLFADLVDSTKLGERLQPETLVKVITGYFDAVRPVIEHHGGTIAKYIGDAVMAVFGLEQIHEDDALRAVRTAAAMHDTLAALNADYEQRYGIALATRTGIHTGLIASTTGMAPDRGLVLGDTANHAARLEQSAGIGEILLSESTFRLVRDFVRTVPIGPIELKGKSTPANAYRLVSMEQQSARLDAPFVGRLDLLAQLEWALDRSRTESGCRLVTVIGSPGIGKSRLIQQFVDRVGDKATVLRGACLPYGEGITFWPLQEMVREAAGIVETDDSGAAVGRIEALLAPDDEAHTVAEAIAQLTGISPTLGPIEGGFWAVRRLVTSLAATRPLVVVLDDAQWAEEMLLGLVEHIARYAEPVPLLLCCVSRPDLHERRPDWGRSIERSTTVRIDPLDAAASDRLIGELLGESEIDVAVRDEIAARADGNPLFIEQMVSMLIDERRLVKSDGHWTLPGDAELPDVPPGINALLVARLERLSADERAVLGRAAVIGQTFYTGALDELASPELVERIPAVLLELVRKEFIRPARSDIGDSSAFAFWHLLLRDAAYEALPKDLRADYHARFADWIDGVSRGGRSELAEIVGWHLEQAHRYFVELGPLDERGNALGRRAADQLAAAGAIASSRGDVSAGASLRFRALELMASGDERRPLILGELGEALLWSGRFDEADEVLNEAITLSDLAGDEMLRTRARLSQLRLAMQIDPAADYEGLEAEASQAAELCESMGDHFGAARAWRVVYWTRWGMGQLARARPAAERAYEHNQFTHDSHYLQSDLIAVLASLVWGPTASSTVLVEGEVIVERVQGNRGAEAHALCFLGQARGLLGQAEVARDMILKGVADRRVLGDHPGAVMARGEGLGYFVEMVRGNWDAAEVELRQSLDELSMMGDKNYLAITAGWLAHCEYALGRFDDADRSATICEQAAAASWVAAQVVWRGVRAMLLARQGDIPAAESLARDAVTLARRSDRVDTLTDALTDLAEVLIVAERAAEAIPILEEALSLYESKEVLPSADRTREQIDTLRQTLARDDRVIGEHEILG